MAWSAARISTHWSFMLSIEKPCGRFTNATAIASAIFFASSTFIFPPRPHTQAGQKSTYRDAPTKPTCKPFHGFSKSPRRAAPACRGYRSGISQHAPGGNAARKAGRKAFQRCRILFLTACLQCGCRVLTSHVKLLVARRFLPAGLFYACEAHRQTLNLRG